MRRWVIGLVPAAIIGVALLSMVGSPQPATAQQSGQVALVSRFFDAWSRGDTDGVLAAFEETAVFANARQVGPCSRTTPCIDQSPIRREIDATIAIHICQTLRIVQVAGSAVTGQFETRTDSDRVIGVERIQGSFIAQTRNDKIVFFAALRDLTDPQTNPPVGTAPRAPVPNPDTPCAGV